MNILKVENLSKKFGKKYILKDVSFEIDKGDILAFIGPNGAGKTTTIKCILGLQKGSGKVLINGYDIRRNFVKAISKVGAIVESPDVYMYLTGFENLKLQANLYSRVTDEDILKLVSLVGLEERINDKVSKYSLGMRQRLGLAIALINSPELLILDEPTNGLDPEGIKDLRNLLQKLAKLGMGILISSHNLSELESFCNKVCIISEGSIIEENTIDKIKEVKDNKYIIKVSDIENILKFLSDKDRIIDDNHIEVIKEESDIALFIKDLVLNDILVYEVVKETLTLEEAFIKRAGGKKID
ncbi:MAG: ABC transporter ATP-binding protein [Ruminococcus sp.]|nr:ABC transporter ATP-binding protein [Ruminococcus sp.]